jgi:hypothetical protein
MKEIVLKEQRRHGYLIIYEYWINLQPAGILATAMWTNQLFLISIISFKLLCIRQSRELLITITYVTLAVIKR